MLFRFNRCGCRITDTMRTWVKIGMLTDSQMPTICCLYALLLLCCARSYHCLSNISDIPSNTEKGELFLKVIRAGGLTNNKQPAQINENAATSEGMQNAWATGGILKILSGNRKRYPVCNVRVVPWRIGANYIQDTLPYNTRNGHPQWGPHTHPEHIPL